MNTCTNEAALNTVFDCTYNAIIIPQNLKPIKATEQSSWTWKYFRVKTPSIDFWALSLSCEYPTQMSQHIWEELNLNGNLYKGTQARVILHKGCKGEIIEERSPLFLFFKYSSVKKRRDFRACWSQLGHQNQVGNLSQSSRFWSISINLQRFKGVVWNFGFKYHKYTERAQTFITTLHEFG